MGEVKSRNGQSFSVDLRSGCAAAILLYIMERAQYNPRVLRHGSHLPSLQNVWGVFSYREERRDGGSSE
jgi:hypothetical protein